MMDEKSLEAQHIENYMGEKLIVEQTICKKCLEEYQSRPHVLSLSSMLDIEVGFTILGIQVWCNKHKCNVCHIDFRNHPLGTLMDFGEVDFN